MFLEECFGIEIEDDAAMGIVTVGDAIEAIKEDKEKQRANLARRLMHLSI